MPGVQRINAAGTRHQEKKGRARLADSATHPFFDAMKNRHFLLLCFVFGLAVALPAKAGTEASFDSLYQQALGQFRAGEYANAEEGFSALLTGPERNSKLLDNCYYWLGECRYADQAWLDALSYFYKVLEFPWPGKEEASRLKIALCWQNLGDSERACLEARALFELFPEGEYEARAKRLAELACDQAAGAGKATD